MVPPALPHWFLANIQPPNTDDTYLKHPNQRAPPTRLSTPVWWVNEIEHVLEDRSSSSTPRPIEISTLAPLATDLHAVPTPMTQVQATSEAEWSIPYQDLVLRTSSDEHTNIAEPPDQLSSALMCMAPDAADQFYNSFQPNTLYDGSDHATGSRCYHSVWQPHHTSCYESLPPQLPRSQSLDCRHSASEAVTQTTVPFLGSSVAPLPQQNAIVPAGMHTSTPRIALQSMCSEYQPPLPSSGQVHPFYFFPDRYHDTTPTNQPNLDQRLDSTSTQVPLQQHHLHPPPTPHNSPQLPNTLHESYLPARTLSPRDVQSNGTLYPGPFAAPCQLSPAGIPHTTLQRVSETQPSIRQQQPMRRRPKPAGLRGQFLQEAAAKRQFRNKVSGA